MTTLPTSTAVALLGVVALFACSDLPGGAAQPTPEANASSPPAATPGESAAPDPPKSFPLPSPAPDEELAPWLRPERAEPLADDCGYEPVGLGPLRTLRRTGDRPECRHLGFATPSAPPVKPAQWSLGEPQIFGTLSEKAILRVVRFHIHEVKSCYERERTYAPLLPSQLIVKFAVASQGQVVASFVLRPTDLPPRAERCITDAFRRLHFSQPRGGLAVITLPFLLK